MHVLVLIFAEYHVSIVNKKGRVQDSNLRRLAWNGRTGRGKGLTTKPHRFVQDFKNINIYKFNLNLILMGYQ